MGEARRRRAEERMREALTDPQFDEKERLRAVFGGGRGYASNVPGGYLKATGMGYNPSTRQLASREVPEDMHDWQAICTFQLSPESAKAAFSAGNNVPLDMENLSGYFLGCMKCGVAGEADNIDTPCIGAVDL